MVGGRGGGGRTLHRSLISSLLRRQLLPVRLPLQVLQVLQGARKATVVRAGAQWTAVGQPCAYHVRATIPLNRLQASSALQS